MSKKFLSGINIVNGNLNIQSISNGIGDILTRNSSNGLITIRTATEILNDIGAVPYTGATQNVNLGEFGLSTGFITFDTTPTNTPLTQGTISWNSNNLTFQGVLNGYIMQFGEDQFYPVKNQTGTTIPKGTAVRFAGTLGNSGRLLIAPFIANGSVPSSFFMGVTAETIANGADGKVLWFGKIRDINTNGFNEGDVLYASTTVAGGFQTTAPQAPNNIVQIAAVITKSANVGEIFVRPQIGSNINNDEGVRITNGQTGDILQIQSNGLFENVTKAQYLGGTSSQFVKGDGSLDSNTYDNYQNWNLEVSGITGNYSVQSGNTIRLIPGSGINILRNNGDITISTAGQTAVRTEYTFTSTSGQTVYNISGGYLLNNLDVYLNGSKLSTNDYTANNQTTVVLNTPAQVGDILQVVVYLVDGVIPTQLSGTGVDKQVTFWNGTNTITGNNDFTWDNTTKVLDINGSFNVKDSKLDYIQNNSVLSGTTVITSIDKTNINAIFFEYVVIKGSNLRAGTFILTTDGTNIEFTETSTNDIGTTTDITLSADISGNNIRLIINSTSSTWIFKSMIRYI